MKIRKGFVSNSSSSSFIISDKDFHSVRDLAKYMIKKQIKEAIYEDYYWKDDSIKDDKNQIKKLKSLNENQPVSFPSCNYDTYIKKIGDQYFVSTCNNTDWDLYKFHTKLSEVAKEELILLLNNYDKNSDDYSNIIDLIENNYQDFYSFGNDYYALDKDIIGIETYEYCPNNDKHNKYTNMWNTQKYGKICLICNPVHKRKEKIENINKISE
jgi:hypothetical protein